MAKKVNKKSRAAKPRVVEIESVWQTRFGVVHRISLDVDGNAVQAFKNDDGTTKTVVYFDLLTQELDAPAIFIKCRASDGALAHFTGLAYDGLADQYVSVETIQTGDMVLVEGYIKYNEPVRLPDGRTIKQHRMFLTSVASIKIRRPDLAKAADVKAASAI